MKLREKRNDSDRCPNLVKVGSGGLDLRVGLLSVLGGLDDLLLESVARTTVLRLVLFALDYSVLSILRVSRVGDNWEGFVHTLSKRMSTQMGCV